MKKAWKITISITACVLTLLLIAIAIYYCWPWNRDFYNIASREFEVPGLDTAFVPQGMTMIESTNEYIVCGYMSDGTASRYYVVDGETKQAKKFFTLDLNGKAFDGHAGGVASAGDTVWTVSSIEDVGYCFRFKYSDVKNVENGGRVLIKDYFKTFNGASNVFVNNGLLWIGEFYRNDNYLTDESHHLQTRSGETNYGLAFAFTIDETMKYGLYNIIPKKALSTRGLCQGLEMTKTGKIIMSTSYGIADSNIYCYKDVLSEEKHSTYRLGFHNIDLWYLDNEALISTTVAPAMSEELFVFNDRVYILFESACKKYKLFNRDALTTVYSIAVSDLEK